MTQPPLSQIRDVIARIRLPRRGAGIALDAHRAVLVQAELRRRGVGALRVTEWTISPPAAEDGWAAVREVMDAVRDDPRCSSAAGFALMRPLCSLKIITLPPLSRDHARRLLNSAPGRFFPRARAPLTDAVGVGGRLTRGTTFVAAAAERSVVQSLLAEARTAGLGVDAILPGPAAAAAGASMLAPEVGSGEWLLVLAQADGTDILFLRKGRPQWVRSLPARCVAPRTTDDAGAPANDLLDVAASVSRACEDASDLCGKRSPRIAVAASGASEEAVRFAFESLTPVPVVLKVSPLALAALGAITAGKGSPVLVPEEYHLEARRSRRRRTAGLALTGAALFLASAGMVKADLARRVAEVRHRRAVLQPAVQEMNRARALLGAVERRAQAVDALDTLRSRKVVLLANLADVLPSDARLTSLREEGERLRLEGTARASVSLLPLLEASRWFEDARLEGPVQGEPGDSSRRERFVLSVRAVSDAERGSGGSAR